jgi:hypothetical protein
LLQNQSIIGNFAIENLLLVSLAEPTGGNRVAQEQAKLLVVITMTYLLERTGYNIELLVRNCHHRSYCLVSLQLVIAELA